MVAVNRKNYPNKEYLDECFKYDTNSGKLYWKERPGYHFKKGWICTQVNNKFKGEEAGISSHKGYKILCLNGKQLLVHRVIFIIIHGYNPEHKIDHINRDRLDNRPNNLRELSESCSVINRDLMINNKSGVTGVCWDKCSSYWQARICVNKNNIFLGSFKTFKNVVMKRWEAEKKYNWKNCLNTSTAYLYLKDNDLI